MEARRAALSQLDTDAPRRSKLGFPFPLLLIESIAISISRLVRGSTPLLRAATIHLGSLARTDTL